MAYTPPNYNAVDFTWQGQAAYTPPAYNGIEFLPDDGGTFAIVSSTTVAAVGFQSGVNSAAFSVAGTSQVSGAIQGPFPAALTSTVSASVAAAGRRIEPRTISITSDATTSFKLGYGVASTFTVSTTVGFSGVSSVGQGAFSISGAVDSNLVGAWDGTSGGNFFLGAPGEFNGAGQSRHLAAFTAAGSTVVTPYPQAIWAVTIGIQATGLISAESAIVKPMFGNMLMPWEQAPTFAAYSAFQKPTAFSITVSAITAAAGALDGDGAFTIAGSTNADFAVLADFTASIAFSVVTKPRGRFYSRDGRDNFYAITPITSVDFVGAYDVAAHAVDSMFGIESRTTLAPAVNRVAQGAFSVDAPARMSSYRGWDYDESESVYVYANTKPREVAIFIGA